MKRKIAIVLAVAMTAVCLCLAGCSGGLSDAEFDFYDADGNVTQRLADSENLYLEEGEYTKRGIALGSTIEEVEAAYGDVLESAKILDLSDEDGTTWKQHTWISGDKILEIVTQNETAAEDVVVTTCHAITKEMDQSVTFANMVDLLGRSDFNIEQWAEYQAAWDTFTDEEKDVLKVLYDNSPANLSMDEMMSWNNGEINAFMINTMAEGWGEITFLTDEEKKLAESAYEKFKENYDFGY